MVINAKTGLLSAARHAPSAHHNDRPTTGTISLLVIHNISLPPGEFENGQIERFFTGCLTASDHPYFRTIHHLKVTSHLLITRSGEIIQFVPFHKRAWHAGESQFNGRTNCNDFSIGIELEGTDDLPYMPIQYEKLAQTTRAICATYPHILPKNIVGHSDIAPTRKTDPGPAFAWATYFNLLNALN